MIWLSSTRLGLRATPLVICLQQREAVQTRVETNDLQGLTPPDCSEAHIRRGVPITSWPGTGRVRTPGYWPGEIVCIPHSHHIQ
ncbi:hypothetical protein F5Y14DRAFT_437113 [Nemania sp. NC0429]|nr:hypothetical protein F5Y14DRAFT_437113 [Nemania sp. NC0429]